MRIKVVMAGALVAAALSPLSAAGAEETWRSVPPNWTWPDRKLMDVEVIGPKDVWAVGGQGEKYVSIPGDLGRPPITLVDIGAKPVLQHWNGTSWKSFSPPGISGEGEIQHVEAVAPDDVYVSGRNGYKSSTEYLAHWDGVKWTEVTPPTSVHRAFYADDEGFWFNGTTALYRVVDGVWTPHTFPGRHVGRIIQSATGDLFVSTGDKISHWNGASWTDFDMLPDEPWLGYDYYYVASGSDLWAIARAGTPETPPRVFRWAGSWEQIPVPDVYKGTWYQHIYDLNGVVISFAKSGSSIYHKLRWTGTAWTELSPADTFQPATPLVAGDGTIWSQGQVHRLTGQTWTPVDLPISATFLHVTPIPTTPHIFVWGRNQNGDLVAATNSPAQTSR